MQITFPDSIIDTEVPIATFDFDETMTLPEYDIKTKQWVHSTRPNLYTINEMYRLKEEGWKIYVISERNKTYNSDALICRFIKNYDLDVDGRIYTGGMEKTSFILSCRSSLHYEDDPFEISALAECDLVTVIKIPHPSDHMDEEDYKKLELIIKKKKALDDIKNMRSAVNPPTDDDRWADDGGPIYSEETVKNRWNGERATWFDVMDIE